MRILYPCNPVNTKEADEPYQEEFMALKSIGVDCSLFDFDALCFDEFKPKPPILRDEWVLYRGWMLRLDRYQKLVRFIELKHAVPVVSYENYLKCHYLPNWYEICAELTAKTVFFPYDEALQQNIASLGWDAYFIKDFVKSNSSARGSIASTAEEALEIVALIQKYRGEIDGGIAVRQVENYVTATETRYFVVNGTAYAPKGTVPDIVLQIAQRIDSPFYSVDIIQREDGVCRLVEIGDGQVSDRKTWDTSSFTTMLLKCVV